MKSTAIVFSGLAALAAAGPGASKADIRVDTNRDGIVDVDGTSDQAGKDTWTDAAGAIFLPNIGDSGDRCKKLHPKFDLPFDLGKFFDTLAKCNDADDDTQRAPKYMAPMRTVPMADLGDDATGTISVADEKSRALVRVFRAAGTNSSTWEIVNNDTVFKAQDLKQGLTLGVDARDTRRPDWDGRVKIDFTVRDGQTESKDSVMLRVAPVLMHHHRQAVSQVFTSDFHGFKGDMKTYLDGILDGIEASVKAAGIATPLTRLPTNDVWAQDFFEPAYASMPGPNGTSVAMRVLLEGLHDPSSYSTTLLYTTLRGDGVGAVAPNRPAELFRRGPDFDAGGNLEAIPPYELNGNSFPAGRIIVGGDTDRQPASMDFLAAQEMQRPLVLDSTWLTVKHVDEMVQAVPAKTDRGWAIIAIDPAMGLQMLRDAEAAGNASARLISRPAPARAGPTIDNFLKKDSNIVATEVAAKAMKANLEILKRETGITDAEIHRVPALISRYEMTKTYHDWSGFRRRGIGARDEASEAALDREFLEKFPSHVDEEAEAEAETRAGTTTEQRRQVGKKAPRHHSVLPSLVNGVPLSDSHYLAPKPFGPVIDGKDIFEEAATAAYKKAGFTTVDFQEEWRIHTKAGDVHCMSNTYRDTSAQWW